MRFNMEKFTEFSTQTIFQAIEIVYNIRLQFNILHPYNSISNNR